MAEVDITGITVGAAGVGRLDDGRVIFVDGALPGERVGVTLTDDRRRFARGRVDEVITAAAGRRSPPCPAVEHGCGGCDFQHADHRTQLEAKRRIVVESLARIGRLDAPAVDHGPDLAPTGHRTQLRLLVDGGRPALRRRHSHDPVPIDSCLVAHPLVCELVEEAQWGDAAEVTLRVGARTGERLAVVAPTVGTARFPDDVTVVGADELRSGRRAWFHEEVAGRRFRISAGSFFQSSAEGADALVATVQRYAAGAGGALVDLYGGVGLFAATVGGDKAVTLVERNRSSVADARVNLAGVDATVVRAAVERWTPSPAGVVVADPARVGLAAAGVTAVAATGAGRVVLVSCDAGSLGRDAALLAEAGFAHRGSTVVDLFPQTSHVEVVSCFDRVGVDGPSG